VNDDRGLRLGLLMRQGELRTFDGRVLRLPVGWSELRDMAQAAEAVGFDTLSLADHLLFRDSPPVQMPPGETRDVYECFSLLSALAASTERVGLGRSSRATASEIPGCWPRWLRLWKRSAVAA